MSGCRDGKRFFLKKGESQHAIDGCKSKYSTFITPELQISGYIAYSVS